MRIYSVADIHGSQYRMNIILEKITEIKPDLVVICGDITQFGPADVAKNFLDQIPIDTLAVHGNIDSADIGEGIDKSKAENIHLKQVKRRGYSFVGIGGALGPIDYRLNIETEEGEKLLDKIINSSSIVVTHVPPLNTMDRVFIGHHAGSSDLRYIMDKYQPRLILCGHIHENPGFIKIGETVIVNCSLGKKTSGACIDVNSEVKVKTLY